jgi:hypothetical protein
MVAPGGVVPLQATLFYSDGTSKDVSRESTWSSSDTIVLRIDATGTATGVSVGEAAVSVSHADYLQRADIIVVPVGTYRLTGTVTDTGGSPLIGASVTVAAPVGGDRLSTVTGPQGTFRIYGVPADSLLSVTLDYFHPVERALQLQSHESVTIRMQQSAAYPDVRGAYDLDIHADDACSAVLPAQLRTRKYTVLVTPTPAFLLFDLGGATFVPELSQFDGSVRNNGLTFWLYRYAWGDRPYPNLSEQVGALVFTVMGTARLAFNAHGAEGQLEGELEVMDSAVRPPRTDVCSGRHRVTMTRR